MTFHRISLGQQGEEAVVSFLAKRGYEILSRNERTRYGEIDIIAKDKDVLCFIEVRTRTNSDHIHPFETVNYRKRRKLTQMALWYIQNNVKEEMKARFDVVAVTPLFESDFTIEILKNAFDLGE